MQQTQNYQLNLIETDDVFSPNPLNENAQKLEAALAGVTEAAAALSGRIAALEVHKIAMGNYYGSASQQTLQVGFTPTFVLTHSLSGNRHTCIGIAAELITMGNRPFQIVEGGFTLNADDTYTNQHSSAYIFVAIA